MKSVADAEIRRERHTHTHTQREREREREKDREREREHFSGRTCLPGQPLDRSCTGLDRHSVDKFWTPGQALVGPGQAWTS